MFLVARVRLARTMRWAIVGSGPGRRGRSRGGEAAEETQGEGGAGLGGEDRVAGGEDEAQEVVVDVVGGGGFLGRGRRLQGAADLLELAGVVLPAPDQVDGAVPRSGHEPGPGLSGTPSLGHCSSAATSASCASSSAIPTSRTRRATAAMTRGTRCGRRSRWCCAGRWRYRAGLRWAVIPGSQPTMQHPRRPQTKEGRAGPRSAGSAQPSAISRTSQVTVQNSSCTFRNRLVHSIASAMSLHCMSA